jgi:hypothetical protein
VGRLLGFAPVIPSNDIDEEEEETVAVKLELPTELVESDALALCA